MSDSDYDSDVVLDDNQSQTTPTVTASFPPTKRRSSARISKDYEESEEKADKPKKATFDLRSISLRLNHITKQLQGADIDRALSLHVIKGALQLQKNHLEKRKKYGPGKKPQVKATAIRATMCDILGISTHIYGNIMSEYLLNNNIYASGQKGVGRSGNTSAKATRIPHTAGLQIRVREFVRDKLSRRERVTGKDVLHLFQQMGIIDIPVDANNHPIKKDYNAAYRSVNRWLTREQYRRGKRRFNMVPKQAVILQRRKYLKAFFDNRKKSPGERLREVYLDELYIHQHYNRNNDSIWDENDDQDIQIGRAPAKGQRYCFAAAIQGPNPRAVDPTLEINRAGLVSASEWIFSPQQRELNFGDYHKVFNGKNFIDWWKTHLLPNLIHPSIIMLDNAKYHLVYGDDVPKPSKMKKVECITYLQAIGKETDGLTAIELKQAIRQFIANEVPIEIVRLAEEQGHKYVCMKFVNRTSGGDIQNQKGENSTSSANAL
jgi:hypothetical protein